MEKDSSRSLHRWGFHDDGTSPSTRDAKWVLVFESNLAGRHGAGAALVAAEHYGAVYGVGEGLRGNSYGIPTKDARLAVLAIEHVAQGVGRFIQEAERRPDKMFWITRVGCGLAGYKDQEIAPLFRDAPGNCNFAKDWKRYLL